MRQKSDFNQHQCILNPIFNGKNIDKVIEHTYIRYKTTDTYGKKKGALLEVAIEPRDKVKSRHVNLVSDLNIIPVMQSSIRSLTYLKLNSCVLLTKKSFEVIGQLENIKKISITNNQ